MIHIKSIKLSKITDYHFDNYLPYNRIPGNRLFFAPIVTRIALILILLATNAPTRAANDFDRWYVIEMQKLHAGWMHEVQTTDPLTGYITTEQEMNLTIKRGTQTMSLRMIGRLEETKEGKPIRLWTLDGLGSEPKETTYTYQDNSIITEPVRENGDNENQGAVTPVTIPDEAFRTPRQAKAYFTEQLKSDIDQFDLTLLDPLSGPIPVHLRYTVLDRNSSIKLDSKTHPAVKWRVTQEGRGEPLESVEFVDENGRLLKGETKFGAFTLTFILSDERNAKYLITAPELLVSTFVKPDRPIRRPRSVKQAKYQLSVTEGALPALPTAGGQTILNMMDNQPANTSDEKQSPVLLSINVNTHHAATPEELKNRSTYLAASPYINTDSPAITNLVKRALKINKDAIITNNNPKTIGLHAEKLRSFVNKFVRNKDLSVGFASADEVARSQSGDCTEHAVLLTAMLRADHIPARIASGLIYAESFAGKRNIFGYHMWTQALINNKWVDLDATLRRPFDATHITLQTTPLNDNSVSSTLTDIATLFGRLRIKIIEVKY